MPVSTPPGLRTVRESFSRQWSSIAANRDAASGEPPRGARRYRGDPYDRCERGCRPAELVALMDAGSRSGATTLSERNYRDIWTVPVEGGEIVPVTRDEHVDWNRELPVEGSFPLRLSDARRLVFNRGGFAVSRDDRSIYAVSLGGSRHRDGYSRRGRKSLTALRSRKGAVKSRMGAVSDTRSTFLRYFCITSVPYSRSAK